jgi:adenine-specific DNA-methyltransferase
MPTLNWIGKDKVVNHHLDVPFYTLEHQYGFRGDKPDDKSETHSGNMIIHGDNLVALKALLPEFEGRVRCAYFDPPYNTGEEKWVYKVKCDNAY